jgi:hypothetical protein
MNQDRTDTRPELPQTDSPEPVEAIDRLDEVEAELDGLAALDPADSVEVLGAITATLNREIDLDMEKS